MLRWNIFLVTEKINGFPHIHFCHKWLLIVIKLCRIMLQELTLTPRTSRSPVTYFSFWTSAESQSEALIWRICLDFSIMAYNSRNLLRKLREEITARQAAIWMSHAAWTLRSRDYQPPLRTITPSHSDIWTENSAADITSCLPPKVGLLLIGKWSHILQVYLAYFYRATSRGMIFWGNRSRTALN